MASRTRQVTETPAPSSSQRVVGQSLPPYEQPAFPLNQDAQRSLGTLAKKHRLDKLEKELADAIATVTNSAGDINERLTEKRRRWQREASRSGVESAQSQAEAEDESNGTNMGDGSQRSMEELEGKIQKMTKRMDESVRKLIDVHESVANLNGTLEVVANEARENSSTQTSTQFGRSQRRTRHATQGEDQDEEERDGYNEITPTDPVSGTPIYPGPSEILTSKLDGWKARYHSRSMSDRYSENNHYRNFRGVVHAAQYPDEDVPLPRPNEWFKDGPAPNPGNTGSNNQQNGDEDDAEDDDVQVSRATTSTKCPITLREFNQPLTSTKCPHTFEASAIKEMIAASPNYTTPRQGTRREKQVQCPVQSCQSILTKADLYEDMIVVRRIKRLQRAKAIQDEELQEGRDQGEGDSSRRRTALIEDDEAVDVDDLDQEPVPTAMKAELQSSRVLGL